MNRIAWTKNELFGTSSAESACRRELPKGSGSAAANGRFGDCAAAWLVLSCPDGGKVAFEESQ